MTNSGAAITVQLPTNAQANVTAAVDAEHRTNFAVRPKLSCGNNLFIVPEKWFNCRVGTYGPAHSNTLVIKLRTNS